MARTHKKSLQPLRERLQLIADAANERVSQLTGSSGALKEAQRTLPKSRREDGELFTGNLRTLKEMKTEYARIQQFLSDWRSSEEGEKYYEEEKESWLKYKDAFGGQWIKKYGETFNTELIDSDLAKTAFDLYDRLVEEYQGEDRARMLWNRNSSLISYGSENMIAAIYDMIARGYSEYDTMQFAREKMEINYLEMQKYGQFEKRNEDYGLLDYFSMDSDKSRKEIIRELNKKGYF